MKTLAISILFCASLVAQQTAAIIPLGPWAICETEAAAYIGFLCAGFVPGHEAYLLLIQSDDPQVVAYRYSVTATLVSTGEKVALSGVVERIDNPTAIINTPVSLYFGGIVKNLQVKTESLATVEVKTFVSSH